MPAIIHYVDTKDFNGDYRKAARWLKEQLGISTRKRCEYLYTNPADSFITVYQSANIPIESSRIDNESKAEFERSKETSIRYGWGYEYRRYRYCPNKYYIGELT